MRATVGDRLHVHSRHIDEAEKFGEIVEVLGADGEPPYKVRYNDGHEGLVFPGSDCVIEPPAPRQGD
ncbi:DUF1918 domain-containing protein [Saccharopolyspora halophila]|uniref:DUF1918 domain-containing protein n=1 Tax=Saccharopolyspora halophila TaxID=405551 RepID=A0ABN3FJ96_9PSEU